MRNTPPLRLLALSAAIVFTPLLLLPISCNRSAPDQHQPTSTAQPVPGAVQEPKPARPLPSESPLHPNAPARPTDQSALPLTDDQLIEQSLARLRKGNLAYNTPLKMKEGSTAHITARIASDKISIEALRSGMPSDQGTSTETEATPVSSRMRMRLESADFDITPLSSEEQIVGGDAPTEWEWDVIPKHAGTLRLHLAAIVELKNLSRDFTTVDRNIVVKVDPVGAVMEFAGKNAVWILGSLGTGITGLWAWWRRRKKSRAPGGQAP